MTSSPRLTLQTAGIALATASIGYSVFASSTTQVLEINSSSLTTVLTTATTNIQDVRPVVAQRAVFLDGFPRNGGGGAQGAVAADPKLSAYFEEDLPPEPPTPPVCPSPTVLADDTLGVPLGPAGGIGGGQIGSIDLFTSAYQVSSVDLQLPAPGHMWTIGRSYNSMQEDSGGAHHDSNGYQGRNWFQNSQPELQYVNDADDAEDFIYMIIAADKFIAFNRVDVEGTPSDDTFKAVNGAGGVILLHTFDGVDLATYYSLAGMRIDFFWFDDDDIDDDVEGSIYRIIDTTVDANPYNAGDRLVASDGNIAYVGDIGNPNTAQTAGYDADTGAITFAYDTAGRRYKYIYSLIDSVERLTTVEVATFDDPSWTDTGDKVVYAYYKTGFNTYGDNGCLETATVTTPLTDSAVDMTSVQYYRYWTDPVHDDDTNPGHEYALQYVVEREGTRNFDYSDSTFDEDFKTASETTLEEYAAAYFEYDSSHRIDLAWQNGACGCAGAPNGTYEFRYDDNLSFSGSDGYDLEWFTRTEVKRPDGSWVTRYFDEIAQPLHEVISDQDPDTASNFWVTKIVRDTDGRVSSIHSPANTSTYTHSTGVVTSKATDGLVRLILRITSGDFKGLLEHTKHKEGDGGAQVEYLDQSLAYETASLGVGDAILKRPLVDSRWSYPKETATVRDVTGSDRGYETTIGYTFHDDAAVLMSKTVTTTFPKVTTDNHGSNSSLIAVQYRREDGTVAFTESTDDVFTYTQFNAEGLLIKRIDDAQTNHTTDWPTEDDPSGTWSIVESGTGLRVITEFAYDDQGRLETTTLNAQTANDKRVLKKYYSTLKDRRQVILRYNDYEDLATDKYHGPVSYSVVNHAGKPEVQAVIALTSNESTLALTDHVDEDEDDPIEAIETVTNELGQIAQMKVTVYNDPGASVEASRLYFAIPSTLPGTDGTHYDATLFGSDDMGRGERIEEPSGTIYRAVYDKLGRLTEEKIGTNDEDISGPDDMVKTVAFEYDSGAAAGGNSYLTKQTLYVEDGDTGKREITFAHDLRGRVRLQTNPDASPAQPHVFNEWDNLGRLLASGEYSSTALINITSDDPRTEDPNRMSLWEVFFDEMGQPYQSKVYKITQSNGDDPDNLITDRWFDAAGRLIKEDGLQLSKFQYDRLGRPTHEFILAKDDDSGYTDADDVAGDDVLEENQIVYDPDSGDAVMTATIDRFHDDYGAGDTDTALDTNADNDDLLYTATNIEGRIHITANWYDRFGRITESVDYGTNGGSNFDRDGLNVPSRSDTKLLEEYVYNTDGTLKSVTDATDIEFRFEYDALGRHTKVVDNYDDGTPGGAIGDEDLTAKYEYADGLPTKIIADVPAGETDQTTTYTYGTTKGAAAGDSKIATGHLLQEVKHPNSGGATDVESFAYNAQSEVIWREDQDGNIAETDFDVASRETHFRITNLATNFDGAVRRVSTTYNNRGFAELVTQYTDYVVGQGDVVDEVKFNYEDWGEVSKFEQDHDTAIGGGLLYDVEYTYEKKTTGRNTLRRKDMTLPDGNVITYSYVGIGGLFGDNASRVTSIKDGGVTLARYWYNGVAQVVGTDMNQPDVEWRMWGATSGVYPDLDRFDRVTSSRWTKVIPSAPDVDFYDVDLTYDRSSSITAAVDNIHVVDGSGSGLYDVAYTLDDLGRLRKAEEGDWDSSTSTLSNRQRQQIWEDASGDLALDQTDNWNFVKLDLDGDNAFTGAGEYEDDRTHSTDNELTARDTDDDGTDDFTLIFNKRGDLRNDGEHYKYEYDPFGRLRFVKKRTSPFDVVAEYTYNGLDQRIGWHYDVDADGDVDGFDPWYRFVYDETWRVVATYRDSDSAPKEQFVHHSAGNDGLGEASFADGVACRDKDANTAWSAASDGTLEERVYYCQNWRNDVSVVVTVDGEMIEWVKYSAYGVPVGLPKGDTESDGDLDNTDVSQIQTWIDAPSGGTYDVRGDLNLDGNVDSTDKTAAINAKPIGLGWGKLSDVGNRRGYAGYEFDSILAYNVWHVRHRVLNSDLGRWMTKDPAGFVDGINLYQYGVNAPVDSIDPLGLISINTTLSFSFGATGVSVFLKLQFSDEGECIKFAVSLGVAWNPPGLRLIHKIAKKFNLHIEFGARAAGKFELEYCPQCRGCLEEVEACFGITLVVKFQYKKHRWKERGRRKRWTVGNFGVRGGGGGSLCWSLCSGDVTLSIHAEVRAFARFGWKKWGRTFSVSWSKKGTWKIGNWKSPLKEYCCLNSSS